MLVLDANILIRAVLGSRVLGLLRNYAGHVRFMAPDVALQEAPEHLPRIPEARKISVTPAIATFDIIARCDPPLRAHKANEANSPARDS